mmetsp:Transcript_8855/g.27494  ORF Transcript_8855/g.27494 Transcript_8855/m.27494 type:complete len:225 (+) Transcript_8855:397-1071(+)
MHNLTRVTLAACVHLRDYHVEFAAVGAPKLDARHVARVQQQKLLGEEQCVRQREECAVGDLEQSGHGRAADRLALRHAVCHQKPPRASLVALLVRQQQRVGLGLAHLKLNPAAHAQQGVPAAFLIVSQASHHAEYVLARDNNATLRLALPREHQVRRVHRQRVLASPGREHRHAHHPRLLGPQVHTWRHRGLWRLGRRADGSLRRRGRVGRAHHSQRCPRKKRR